MIIIMLFLELFAGTKSAAKVAARRKYRTITIDNDDRYNPTYAADILTFDYKKLETPDVIWASPPCTTFSNLTLSKKQPDRDKTTFKALTEAGRQGDRLLARTLKIIRYFKSKNPKLKWVIENPHAMMRKQPSMKNFDMATTTYCQYGSQLKKPTDFFNNFNLQLKAPCTPNHPHAPNPKHLKFSELPNARVRNTRGAIPPKLISAILQQAKPQGRIRKRNI
jgi:hypothetical protein